ncbi:MAG: di-heme oxidoredictase family protein [Verrucomicrobiota bacterium]
MKRSTVCLTLTLLVQAVSADQRLSGGDTTVFVTSEKAFARPLANIERITRRHHAVGNSFFNQNWVAAPASTTARDGLGPMFNSRSCSGCHVRDGRGEPPKGEDYSLGLLMRLSIAGRDPHGGPLADPNYGLQLSERALPGVQAEGHLRIRYEEIEGRHPDGETYSLRRPTYEITDLAAGPLHPDIRTSPRVAPAVHGLGLLEAVDEDDILAREDPDDRNEDGISGHANRVWNIREGKTVVGRFGWKANQPSLEQQTAGAFVGDLGITSPLFPAENHTAAYAKQHEFAKLPPSEQPEIDEKILQRVTVYLQTLAPPAHRDVDAPAVERGRQLFTAMQCASCHVPEMRTGDFHPVKELRNQTIRPYTDLLLHDMGEELADGRPDYRANGREWRTPPLWGIGLQERVNGHTTFLHDGRARNLAEAILWHGGEAEGSREAFHKASKAERDDLIAFLKSL